MTGFRTQFTAIIEDAEGMEYVCDTKKYNDGVFGLEIESVRIPYLSH